MSSLPFQLPFEFGYLLFLNIHVVDVQRAIGPFGCCNLNRILVDGGLDVIIRFVDVSEMKICLLLFNYYFILFSNTWII